jgi:Fur family zinc uptake transcriptional regulator
MGAYDIIDRLAAVTGKRLAPVTVYRALDYLLAGGLVHRLASRNTFMACGHQHEAAEPVVFLICDGCGSVREATSDAIRKSLADVVGTAGFRSRTEVIELVGLCRTCQANAAA